MSIESVERKREEVEHLRDALAAAEKELKIAEASKSSNPVAYLGRLIYANKTATGSYGYDYGDFGEAELKRAQFVLDTAQGDVDIAEAFITKFYIR